MKKSGFGVVKPSIVLLLLLASVYGIKSQDFEVIPVVLDFAVEPNESESKSLMIRNHSNKIQSFSLSAGDFYKDRKGDKVHVPAGSTRRSLADWINISPSYVEVNPNETATVNVILQVPANEYATKWGVIYVTSMLEQTAMNADKMMASGVKVSGSIAVKVSQSPRSNNKLKATITNLVEVKNPKENGRYFSANINNVGDKILKCKVYLIASDIRTSTEFKSKQPVKIESFPESSTTVLIPLPEDLPNGKYALAAILDYGAANLEGVQTIIDVTGSSVKPATKDKLFDNAPEENPDFLLPDDSSKNKKAEDRLFEDLLNDDGGEPGLQPNE